ncbi:uncharacterized protein N7483_004029 [Penicillium malachiteum]|uniref:uncharacterized protein n=1 Tax=Penicillium malachiteum TaxID=1324776 RepID=UPI002547FE96|nr:uncharacterized protein N7483_004029 [Penicillium malachiteum]KAJ5729521.1 hypothetical protein N7483_004029 [Penicillium malachiteum]
MAYQIEYAAEQDAPELGLINNDSFHARAILPAMFPESSQPTLRAYKAVHVMKHLANPETHVLKATDPTSGAIVGYGRWHVPAVLGVTPNVPGLSEQAQTYAKDPIAFAPEPMNREVNTAFRALLEEGRKRHTTERDMMLDLLATLPSCQGRGVGTALLLWGTELADKLQARIYLESTPEGYPLYLKYGWKKIDEATLDLDQLNSHGKDTFVLMMRDPQPVS